MKHFFNSVWLHRLLLLVGLIAGGRATSHAQVQTIRGTIKKGTGNSVDVYYKATRDPGTTLSTGSTFTRTSLCVSIPVVSPAPSVTLTVQPDMGGMTMLAQSAANGFPVKYQGRLFYIWVMDNPPTTAAVFKANKEFKAFNVAFSGSNTAAGAQVNDNQVSTDGVDELGQGQFYISMSGLNQVSPDPTNSGNNYANVTGNPFYGDTGASTTNSVYHPANPSAPRVSPGGTDWQAQVAQPLPVTLVAFTAAKQGEDGRLSWRTAAETNSDYFEVQASTDGQGWQALGRRSALGTSSVAHDYGYLDLSLARYRAPIVYYRLRQVDVGGQEYYSPVVTLSPGAPVWEVTAYPNPYANELSAQLVTAEAGPVTIVMLDAAGRQVLSRQASGQPGHQVFHLDEAHAFPIGTYTLLVRQNGHTGTVRVVRE